MSRLSGRFRISVMAAVLAAGGSLLLVPAPVQAEVKSCLPQFAIRVQSQQGFSGDPSEVVIGPAGVLTGEQTTAGFVIDPCPGDGLFDIGAGFRYLGRVWLRDGTSYEVTDFGTAGEEGVPPDRFFGSTHVPYGWDSAPGRADFGVWAGDDNGHWAYATTSFYVRRHVTMTFNARPEPVKKGGTITVSGVVTRLTFDATGVPRYVPYVNKTVHLEWNPRGGWSGIEPLALVKTNARGAFSKNFTATVDAVWFGVSRPTPYHAEARKPGDSVDVQ